MSIKADFHLHSSYSGDSQADMEGMIQKAISLGFKDIAFTEHMDLNFPTSRDIPEGMFECNVDSYLYHLLGLRNKYINDINVRFGLELGLQPDVVRQNVKVCKEHDFDFVIGSIHVVNGDEVYSNTPFFENKTDEEAYREYFEGVYENLRSYSNFDVVGHLDYVVRYGKTLDKDYSYDKYKDVLDKILQRIIDREKGIELNTGAVAYGLKELNPCMDILKRYKALGGEIITIGSDAHKIEDIGRGFDRAEEALREAGFEYYTVYDARIPVQMKL